MSNIFDKKKTCKSRQEGKKSTMIVNGIDDISITIIPFLIIFLLLGYYSRVLNDTQDRPSVSVLLIERHR